MTDAVAKVRKIKWKVNRYATFFKCLRLQSAFSPFFLHLFHPNKHHFYPDNLCALHLLQRYSVTVPKSVARRLKITLYLYINIEVFMGCGKAFREL